LSEAGADTGLTGGGNYDERVKRGSIRGLWFGGGFRGFLSGVQGKSGGLG